MFLSHAVLKWPSHCDVQASPPETDYVSRAQEVWRHANKKLVGSPTELDLVDCIGTLKRAINHRLKSIQATYRFDLLPSDRPKKQVIEKMQDYGLVRPIILKELLEVRNGIEHNDAPPPDLAKCAFYVDIVWYFLKSTDTLVDMTVNSMAFKDSQSDSVVYFTVEPLREWEISVTGYLHNSHLHENSLEGDLQLSTFTTSKVLIEHGFTKFTSIVEYDKVTLKKLASEYFNVSGYSHED